MRTEDLPSIDYPSFLAKQDMVWEDLPAYFYAGPFIGNGLIGAVIHRMDPDRFDGDTDKVLWEINRADLTAPDPGQAEGHNWSRLAVGRFELKPTGACRTSSWRLDIWNAEVRGEIRTDCGLVRVRTYAHATRPLLVTEVEWREGERVDEVRFVPDTAGRIVRLGRVDLQESATYESFDPPRIVKAGGIVTHRQPLGAGNRAWTAGWMHRRADNAFVHLATISFTHPVAAPAFDARELLERLDGIAPETLVDEHRTWWHDFHRRRFVSLPDKDVECLWWCRTYAIGSCMREGLQMMDLMGPWYCHTPWRGIWWNWNTQGMYLPLVSMNYAEAVKPLIDTLWNNRAQLQANVPAFLQGGTAGIGRASGFDCVSRLDFECGEPYAGREAGNLVWALHPAFLYCRATGDDATLREKVLPLLILAVGLYLKLAWQDDDKRLHLPPTCSPEYGLAPDCSYDLSLLRWGCRTLLDICHHLAMDHPDAQRWRDVLDNLVEMHRDRTGLMIGAGVPLTHSHRYFSHLLGLFPLSITDFSDLGQRELARLSVDHWLSLKGNLASRSYGAASCIHSLMGDGEKAREYLHAYMAGLTPNTSYRVAGMLSETAHMAVVIVNHMLLQYIRGTIRIFPAIPSDWPDCCFSSLGVEGGFLVSAVRRGGRTCWVRIESRCSESCTLECDIAPGQREVHGIDTSQWDFDGSAYHLRLTRGDTVIINERSCRDACIYPVERRFGTYNHYGTPPSNGNSRWETVNR